MWANILGGSLISTIILQFDMLAIYTYKYMPIRI